MSCDCNCTQNCDDPCPECAPAAENVAVDPIPNPRPVLKICRDFEVGSDSPSGLELMVVASGITITLPKKPRDGFKVTIVAAAGAVTVIGESDEDACGDSGYPICSADPATVLACTQTEYEFIASKCKWTELGGTFGGIGIGEIIVANIAAVEALDDANLPEGIYARPLTVDQAFELAPTSTATADGITILNTLSSNGGASAGRWLRVLSHVPRWTAQRTWYVDYTNGSDENTGAASNAAVKTLSEVARRLQAVDFTNYTVNLLTDVPDSASDLFDFSPSFTSSGQVELMSMNFTIKGTQTVAASGTLTDAEDTDTATNTQLNIETATPLSIMDLVYFTSGARSGYHAFVLKDLGSNKYRLSNLYNAGSGGLTSASGLLAGDTFDVRTLTTVNTSIRWAGDPTRLRILWENVDFSPTSDVGVEDAYAVFTTCKFRTPLFPAAVPPSSITAARGPYSNAYITFAGTLLAPPASPLNHILEFDLRVRLNAAAILNAVWHSINTGRTEIFAGGAVGQGSNFNVGRAWNGLVDTSTEWGQLAVNGNGPGSAVGLGLGIFDATGDALTAVRDSIVTVDGPLFGDGSTGYGTRIIDGAKMFVKTGVTPSLTAVGGALDLDGMTSFYQQLELHAPLGGTPAQLVPLTTWGQWAAAVNLNVGGFNRYVLSFKSGAKIVNVGTANP